MIFGRKGHLAAFAQDQILPPELMPGSPNHTHGWTTLLPSVPDGFPLNPPITVTANRRLDAAMQFPPGDDINNNHFTRMMSALFGVNWQAAFTWVTDEDAVQKLNLAIASNDLPDMLEAVPVSIFTEMLEADLLEDITDVYEQYASEEWIKRPLEYGGGGLAWSYAEVNGRKYGLPAVESAAQGDALLWVREDWLEAVGMTVPTNLEELAAVALAFKGANLGQGAEGTTIGLAAAGSAAGFLNWYASLDPVFGAYGVIPGSWTPEGDGLMQDSIRPQTKEVLALLRQWYADGVLAPDFFTVNPGDAAFQLVGGNKAGLHLTPYFAPLGGLPDSVTNDPDARWTFADVPTGPAGRHKAWFNPFRANVFAFRKGFSHVDAVIQQINWLAELLNDPARRFHGWEGFNYEWEGDQVKLAGLDAIKYFYGPVGTAGSSRIDPLARARVEGEYVDTVFANTPPNERDAMMDFLLEDPTGLQALYRQAMQHAVSVSEEQGIKNLFTGLPTPGMVDLGIALADLESQTFIGIVTGELPVDEFDNFVETWKALGGEQVTNEVNEWWANH